MLQFISRNHQSKRDRKLADKRLIVHIGQHKTGSTAIQRACAKVGDLGDFYYPKSGRLHAGHHRLPRVAQSDPECKSSAVEEFLSECATAPSKNIIVSSEFFSSRNELMFDEPYVRKALGFVAHLGAYFAEVVVVLYIRDQLSSIDSRLGQAVKSRISLASPDWKSLLDNPSLQYDWFLEFVKMCVPDAVVIPRLYERSVMVEGDIRCDFFEALSIRIDRSLLPVEESNEKLRSAEAVYCALKVNELKLAGDDGQKLKARLGSLFPRSEYSMLSEHDAHEILGFYRPSNQRLEEVAGFGDQLPGNFYQVNGREFPFFRNSLNTDEMFTVLIKALNGG